MKSLNWMRTIVAAARLFLLGGPWYSEQLLVSGLMLGFWH